ncbi:uncharacterized protein TNIN_35011 [Trichonephila inaurata madagascariensis]|uniref:Uncharacterized protein n=1 Tax=Trichonephila inaurata madagascariensis TaxID=2747483 RepID=A0A8X6Y0R5_9ARAC|nr:uncharacterized protein TNIN_35011 [Trichonephila inaurata madagascariensis]
MNVLKRFIEVCLQKPKIVLEDCVNPSYTEATFSEIFYVPMLLGVSIVTTVYLLINRNLNIFTDTEMEDQEMFTGNECGDFNLMNVEPPPELYWEYDNEMEE